MKSKLIDNCIFCLQLNCENAIKEVSYEKFKEAIDFVFTFKIMSTLEDERRKVCRSCVDCIMEFYNYAKQVKKNQESINSLETDNEEQLPEESICSTNGEPPQTSAEPSSSVILISDESDTDAKDPMAISDDDLDAEESSHSSKSHTDDRKQNASETISCPRCNESFRSKRFLAKHMKSNVDCSIGGILWQNPIVIFNDDLDAEETSHSSKSHTDDRKQNATETFSCPRCNKSFRSKIVVAKHMKSHVDCSICFVSFTNRADMRKHVREMHNKETTTICEMCGKLISKLNLKYHMDAVHSTKPVEILECEFCSKKFSKLASLRSHVKAIHKEAGKSFACDLCSNSYSTSRGLRGHKGRVHVECRYSCTVCNRQFKRQVNLNEHMAAHTGIALYKCDVCGHGFNSNANMYVHIKRKHPTEWREKNHERLLGRRRRLHKTSQID